MSVPKGTTPPPTRYYTTWNARDPDATPAWINDDVRRMGERMGSRAKKTTPLKPTDPPPPMHPIMPTTTIRTLDVCWDCGGSGKTGSILHHCPVCGIGWTWEQMEALARRDPWGKWILPCSDIVPSKSIKRRAELCPTCYDQPVRGHIVLDRTWGDIAAWLVEVVRHHLGLTEGDLPNAARAFASSEPTAPAPPLGSVAHGVLTPKIPNEF